MTQEEADGELQAQLEELEVEAMEALSGWDSLGPARRGAVLAFLFGPGCSMLEGFRVSRINKRLQQLKAVWKRPEAVPDLIEQFNRSPLGRILPGLAARRKLEADSWQSETPMATRFKARQETFLKKAPIPSSYLSSSGKVKVLKDKVITCLSVDEIAADAHDWVTLSDQAGRWCIFRPHWELLGTPAPAQGKLPEVNWNDMSSPVGRYISVGEVLRNDPRRKPLPGSPQEARIVAVCREFDKIREAWGGPILVTSGYRPEPFNRQVGGVPNSRHVTGDALDISPVDGRVNDMFQWLKSRWSGGLGDGRKNGFIHIDMRDDGRFYPKAGVIPAVIWDYV
jgi:hypothetical protein